MAGLVQSRVITGTSAGVAGTSVTYTLTLNAPVRAGSVLILTMLHTARFSTSARIGIPTGGGTANWQRLLERPTVNPGSPGRDGVTFVGFGSSGGVVPITVVVTPITTSGETWCAILSEWEGVSPVLSQPDAANTTASTPSLLANAPIAQVSTSSNTDLIYAAFLATRRDAIVSGPSGGFAQFAHVVTTFQGSDPAAQDWDEQITAAWRTTTVSGTYTAGWTTDATLSFNPAWWGHALALRLTGPAAALAARDQEASGDFAVLTAPAHITVPAPVLDLPDRHIFGGVDLATFAVNHKPTIGANSHPSLRGEQPAWSGLPGTQPLEQLPNARIYSLELYVHGLNPDGTTGVQTQQQARINLDALQAVLAVPYEQPLIRVMPDGTGRQAMAKVYNVQEIDARPRNHLFGLRVDFYLSDPWFYSDAVIDQSRAISGTPASVTFSMTHPGTVRGHHVLLDILGPVANPRITNLTTNTWVKFNGTAGTNQRLLIDCEHFSAFLVGANVVGSISHDGGVPWLWMAPGINVLRVESTAASGTLTVTFSPPFV